MASSPGIARGSPREENRRLSRPTCRPSLVSIMLFSRNKPQWLYASLPALYLAGGIAVIALLRNTLGLASGALMIAAAVAILGSRRLGARMFREAEASRQSSILAPPSRLAATTEFVRAIVPPKLGHKEDPPPASQPRLADGHAARRLRAQRRPGRHRAAHPRADRRLRAPPAGRDPRAGACWASHARTRMSRPIACSSPRAPSTTSTITAPAA